MDSTLISEIPWESRCRDKMSTWTSLTFTFNQNILLLKYWKRIFQPCFILFTIRLYPQFWSIILMNLEPLCFKCPITNLLSILQKFILRDNWLPQCLNLRTGSKFKKTSTSFMLESGNYKLSWPTKWGITTFFWSETQLIHTHQQEDLEWIQDFKTHIK
jgi:hypothetical protein